VSVQELLDEEARVLAEERRSKPTDETPKPHSLEDAVIQKLSETSPAAPGTHHSSPLPPPIIEPSELRPRSNPPSTTSSPPAKTEEVTEVETIYEAQIMTPTAPTEPAKAPTPAAASEPTKSTPSTHPERSPGPAVARLSHPPTSQNNNALRWAAAILVVALAGVVIIKQSMAPAPTEPPSVPVKAEALSAVNILYTDAPQDSTLAPGEGWLEVHAGQGAQVFVDGVQRPAGPIPAGPHEVRVGERTQSVDVRVGKTARVDWP
jgi:hypothetical protein